MARRGQTGSVDDDRPAPHQPARMEVVNNKRHVIGIAGSVDVKGARQ